MVGIRFAPPAMAAAPDGTPGYLLRSSYLSLSTPAFSTSSAKLQLQAVTDLGMAATDKSFAGSEDAFALEFSSDGAVPAGIQTLTHPDLGTFDLTLEEVNGSGYEAVINRSVNAPKHSAPKPPPPAPKPAPAANPVEQKHPVKQRPAHVKRLSARRVGRAVVAEIGFSRGADVKAVSVWLSRKGLAVAVGERRHVHAGRLSLRLPTERRLHGGHYDLTVETRDRHGHTEYKRVRIALQ